MRHVRLFAAATAAILTAYLTEPAAAQDTEPAVIEFANLGGIRNWRADADDDALLIEGRNGRWYRATFMNSCPEINYSNALAFVTDATGDLTQFSSIIAGDTRCYFKTFERSASPEEIADASY